jgi:hypothetical protein
MLAFFRRIRKSLVTNNSTKKYLLYAFGEIILVVIGILIAINLNNNNQNKVAKNERDNKIAKLRQVVYSDSLNLMFTINYNKKNIVLIDSLIENINPEMSIDEYRVYANQFTRANMQYRTSIPDLTVYNELINSGEFSKIENKGLKDKITNYYVLFNHFNDLINKFIDALVVAEKRLFYNGILSHKYFSFDVSENNIINGYREFRTTMNDSLNRRIFENHLFELKDMHNQIIYFYTVVVDGMKGIPLQPKNP